MIKLLLASLLLASSTSYAQVITNGSLNGTAANGSVNNAGTIGVVEISNSGLPDDWYLVNTVNPGLTTLNSPDTQELGKYGGTPLNSHNASATPVASPDGGQWIGIGKDRNIVDGKALNESFGQMLTGLTVGASYNLSWQDAHFGGNTSVAIASPGNSPLTFKTILNDPNAVRATLGAATLDVNTNYYNLSGSPEFTFTGSTRSVGDTWTTQNFASFQATQDSYFLAFDLVDYNNSSYLSIDGISVTELTPLAAGPSPVPEPETWAMLLGGLLLVGFQARRRKYNS